MSQACCIRWNQCCHTGRCRRPAYLRYKVISDAAADYPLGWKNLGRGAQSSRADPESVLKKKSADTDDYFTWQSVITTVVMAARQVTLMTAARHLYVVCVITKPYSSSRNHRRGGGSVSGDGLYRWEWTVGRGLTELSLEGLGGDWSVTSQVTSVEAFFFKLTK